jgi:DNA phosphorothioation-dependent restriction protein DptH
VQSLSGSTIGLIVTAAHPLRLAWHAAYDLLAAHARYEDGLSAFEVIRVLAALDSAHFPAALPGLEPGQGFVFGDMLGFHAVAMVADRDPEPKAAIAQMATCLADGRSEIAPSVGARTADVLAREVRYYLDCHSQSHDGEALGPELLQVHARKAGDAMTVARALGKVLADLSSPDSDDDEPAAGRHLCFALDLFLTPEQTIVAGRFLAEVGRRHRSGAGQVDRQDRWLLETAQRPGGVVMPRLRWARRTDGIEVTPAHVALTFNNFVSELEIATPDALGTEPRPIHAYGLVAPFERRVSFEDEPTWRLFVPAHTEGQKHPAGRAPTDRLGRLHEAVLRAVARHLGGDRGDWPVLATRLSREGRDDIDKLHRTSDWVVSVDRNACVEYFDSPRDMRTVYDAYVIDCVSERDDLGSLQLVTSTTNVEEVRALLDRVLSEMGLSSSERNCRMLLDHLKALSGRLASALPTLLLAPVNWWRWRWSTATAWMPARRARFGHASPRVSWCR